MTTNVFKSVNEAPRGYTHRFAITHADLTETTANTAQTIALVTLPVGTVVLRSAMYLKTPFQDSADGAHNATGLIVGDSGDTDRLLTATELNVNGTEILAKAWPSTVPYAAASSTVVNAIFSSMSAKNLAALDTGEVWIYLAVADLTTLG